MRPEPGAARAGQAPPVADESGGGSSRPRLRFDHALVAVPDLGASVRAFESRYGLTALAGGRHPGVGTANAIVPLGDSQYLELIAVVDAGEAARDPLRHRLAELVRSGQTFGSWALRTDDLAALAAQVAVASTADGARDRPDGSRLAWRSGYPAGMSAGTGVPFFIQWLSAEHPGAGPAARAVRRVVVEDAPDGPVRSLLERVDVDVEVDLRPGAAPRLVALELDGLTIR